MPYLGLKPLDRPISGTDLEDGSVLTADIADGAITTAKLDDAAVTAAKVAAAGLAANTITAKAVGTAAIADAAITGAKVAAAGLGSNTIASGAVTIAKVDVSSLAGGNAVFSHLNNTYKKSQVGQIVTLGHLKGEGAVTANTVTLNFANGNHFSWTTNVNVTVSNPVSANTGQTGSIIVTSNGNYTVSFAENWRFPAGTAPTLSATAGMTDRIDYFVIAANAVQAVATVNYDDKA